MDQSDAVSEISGQGTQRSLPPGYRLQEYEIVRELGSGGFGITYLAMDRNLRREVVIKENLPHFAFRDGNTSRVHPNSTTGEDAGLYAWSLESFAEEARMLARFDHPNIVKVLRVFEENNTAYFVMPFVAGRSLSEVLKDLEGEGRAFAEDELRDLLLALLGAVGELHREGVYHRDIKPGNILVTAKGPVLVDFGAARQRVSEKSLTVVESPGYTPFEQLQSRGNVGPWSDLYGLAATVYRVITGAAPPKATDRVKRDPTEVLATSAERTRHYSEGFLKSVDRSLCFDEEGRAQSAEEWVAELTAVEGGLVVGYAVGTLGTVVAEEIALAKPYPTSEDVPGVVPDETEAKKPVEFKFGVSGENRRLISSLGGAPSQRAERTPTRDRGASRRVATVLLVTVLFMLVPAALFALLFAKSRKGGQNPNRPAAALAEKAQVKPPDVAPRGNSMEGTRAGETREMGGIEMVWCPPGEFLMGSPPSEEGRGSDETRYQVTFTKGFWIAKTECTQKQWEDLIGDNPSEFKGADRPVENVSYLGIYSWLKQLRENYVLPTGWEWELPTEAQWEYACRAGTESAFAGTGDLNEMGWHYENTESMTSPAAAKRANNWGLYDLHGNVVEWCSDLYAEYPVGSVIDPPGISEGPGFVFRGGGWRFPASGCRSAWRGKSAPEFKDAGLGFRPSVVPVSSTTSITQSDLTESAGVTSQPGANAESGIEADSASGSDEEEIEFDQTKSAFWEQAVHIQLLIIVSMNRPNPPRQAFSEFLERNSFESDSKGTFSKKFETCYPVADDDTLNWPILVFNNSALAAVVVIRPAAELFEKFEFKTVEATSEITVCFAIDPESELGREIEETFSCVFEGDVPKMGKE